MELLGFIYNFAYAIMSEFLWLFVGVVVGFSSLILAALIIGPSIRKLLGKPKFSGSSDPGIALSMLPMITMPLCGGISLMAATFCQGLDVESRVKILLLTNGCMFLVLSGWATLAYI
eukprot:CAMPEP_0185266470 /NCGR_PEP_ID=MMETSP1359-20130426/31201_1 /TAXON_ID=552665 /ORGANISM="Bigelowiella longifila, Strain CCMP242" /LENGTH=116 /DNA_ID=CAMNT_0027856299 /DNA_START=151 /DNA_END=501 /DNA_ORIENTATION=-